MNPTAIRTKDIFARTTIFMLQDDSAPIPTPINASPRRNSPRNSKKTIEVANMGLTGIFNLMTPNSNIRNTLFINVLDE